MKLKLFRTKSIDKAKNTSASTVITECNFHTSFIYQLISLQYCLALVTVKKKESRHDYRYVNCILRWQKMCLSWHVPLCDGRNYFVGCNHGRRTGAVKQVYNDWKDQGKDLKKLSTTRNHVYTNFSTTPISSKFQKKKAHLWCFFSGKRIYVRLNFCVFKAYKLTLSDFGTRKKSFLQRLASHSPISRVFDW